MREVLHVGAQLDDPVSKHLQGSLAESAAVVSAAGELEPAHLLPITAEHPGPITNHLNILDQSEASSSSLTNQKPSTIAYVI